MYIEKKKIGTDVGDLIRSIRHPEAGERKFPYKSCVSRCSYCLYSTKGKCSLKECCCMDERIAAHTCTFGEMMRYCFGDIGDPAFRYRLRLAVERISEVKSCFLNAGHRKRFYEGLAQNKKASSSLMGQIFLLSVYGSVWNHVKKDLESDGVVYSALEINAREFDVNGYHLFLTAMNLEYGAIVSNLPDLSDEETVDFDVFRVACCAVAIGVYGLDAVKISEKQRAKRKKHQRKEVRKFETLQLKHHPQKSTTTRATEK